MLSELLLFCKGDFVVVCAQMEIEATMNVDV